MQATVGFEIDQRLGILTLARPASNNACDPAFIDGLAAAALAATDADIGALLIRADGANFCVGADLKHLASVKGDLADALDAMAITFHHAVTLLADLPVPVIGAVQGHAVGAGFGLALVCDQLLIADGARFSTGYARLGLSADAGVSFHLTRALGVRQARSLLMVPRTIGAAEMIAFGLADAIVADTGLQAEALRRAHALAVGPTDAFAVIKQLTGRALDHDLAAHLDLERTEIVSLTRRPDAQQRIAAVLG
ncbi:enoyl-CoA hydratase/isomerase family protein [Sphingopyxis sp.]|uniref:enoyl-CoA hydratase/isomerase family protein n=1 Tax=Sphingopyxis sp. TaxID=1908224 RepID=UPI003D10593D